MCYKFDSSVLESFLYPFFMSSIMNDIEIHFGICISGLQNSPFYQNRNAISKAKVLAAKKDVDSVKELASSEVANNSCTLSQWSIHIIHHSL